MRHNYKLQTTNFKITSKSQLQSWKLAAGICFAVWILLLGFSASAIPIISNVEPTSISNTSFIITWTTTNELSSTEIQWGSGGLTNVTTVAGTSKYHRVELTGLYQNTTYQYRIKSGDTVYPPSPFFTPLSFTTLTKPSGEYLFSFAVMNDLRYAEPGDKANTKSAMGIPYELCSRIVSAEVVDINAQNVAFTVINGNIADSTITYNNQIKTQLRFGQLFSLNGASDLPSSAYDYVTTPGIHDKKATYTTAPTDWLSDNILPLTSDFGTNESRYTPLYGYNAASKEIDSVFNYQFKYKYYNFIFLDSVKKPSSTAANMGQADLSKVYGFLSAESNSKTFVFMSYPGYNPMDASTKDYPVDMPSSEITGGLYLSNHDAFRSTLEAFTDASSNPIVAAVISGHLGDNYKRDINGISYVRQGPAVQYPTGYSVYKVYSTGYVKTFYKTTGSSIEADGDTKPFFEYARDQISGETVSGQTLSKDVLTQFWLGSSSCRNFTYEYAFIPGVSPKVISTAPASSESGASLNGPILITFNKRMQNASDLIDWITIRDGNGNSLAVTSASLIDASRTILQINHVDFLVNNSYTIRVNASKAKDEGLTPMDADFFYTFDTIGGKKDTNPPSASVNALPNNTSTDSFPTFTGTATDESRVIVVQFRFDNTGSWGSTEAVDGSFTGSVEVFQLTATSPLADGSHTLWLKTSDGAGNTTAEGFPVYNFTIASESKPIVSSFKLDSTKVYSGDTISSTPKIEITFTSNQSIESSRITIDKTTASLPLVKIDTNYYGTYEVTTALADGTHGITVEAFDVYDSAATYEVYPLYTQSNAATAVQGAPLNYPNPFDPGTQATAIGYTLSKSTNITLTIHDLSGNMIVKKSFTSTDSGGKVGYNEVAWDGKSDTGDYVGNGIYTYLIIGDGAVLAKGKITVIKR